MYLAVLWFASLYRSPKYSRRLLIMRQVIICSTWPLWAFFRPFHSFYWPQIKLWTLECFTWYCPYWADEHPQSVRKIPDPQLYDENSQFAKSKKFPNISLHLTSEYKVTFSTNIWGHKLVTDIFIGKLRTSAFQNTPWFWNTPFYS